jgi:Cu-Zn family superoxide dismutase
MYRFRNLLIVAVVVTLGAATAAFAGSGGGRDDRGDRGDRDRRHGERNGRVAGARLVNTAGERVGKVWFKERGRDGAVWVFARVHDLPAGFHGFHIHTTGACEAPDFTSAGGHFNPTGATHGGHAGDLPTLLVNENGGGMLATVTDRFALADLRDADGTAVIVHELPDNYANIPDVYGEPNEVTLNTGDAGSRLACGVLR